MKLRYLIFAMLFSACAADPGKAAVQLSSLNSPTMQTLIAMGSTPVTVGPYQFSNFSFVDASTTTRTAAQVQVSAISGTGYGLQFVAGWIAADGTTVYDIISYDVQMVAGTLSPIAQISLLSNGTAPVPATGTFVTATLVSQLASGGTASPVLSTYNDGVTSPDTTKADVNYATTFLSPQTQLHITDTLIGLSSAATGSSSGGLATASILQNAFVPVPEPSRTGWMILLIACMAGTFGRRHRQLR